MRSSRLRLLVVCAGAIGVGVAIASCDYFLQGTYTGLCDEPATLFGDLGDPVKVRMAQCQVQNNVCCHHKPATVTGLPTDLKTYCLQQYECYAAGDGGPCFNDIDCNSPLQCQGTNPTSTAMGTCACPDDGVFCPATSSEAPAYCCPGGMMCGSSSDCMPPPPPMDGGLDGHGA